MTGAVDEPMCGLRLGASHVCDPMDGHHRWPASGVARFVVKSMDEAVEWAKHVPFEALSRIYPGEDGAVGEIEIRQLFEPERSDASN